MQPLRAWIQADEITVPAIAKGEDIRIHSDRLSLTFHGGGSELYAIATGKTYTVQEKAESFADGFISQGRLRLGAKWNECTIIPEKTTEAIAYIQNGETIDAVDIVEKINGRNQIAIASDLSITASPELANLRIGIKRLPVYLPPSVMISAAGNTIQNYDIHLVYEENRKFYYGIARSCTLIDSSQTIDAPNRTIEFIYSKLESEFLCSGD